MNMELHSQNSVKIGLELEVQIPNAKRSQLMDSSLWGELPEDLELNLLAHLPLPCLARFRTVCKKWSRILSSTYFMNLWNEVCWPQPWLIMCTPKTEAPCLAYSFTTNTWQTLSLSFLPDAKYGITCVASAGSLLLLEIRSSGFFNSSMLCICNPMTKSFTKIPYTTCITAIMAKGMTELKNGGYSILAVGKTEGNFSAVQVYESGTKSWRIAGRLPDGLCIRSQEMVFCNGLMFCVTVKPCGVMVYSVQNGSWNILAMPVHEDVEKNVRPWVVACGSKVFMVEGNEKDIIIWEILIDSNTMNTATTAAATIMRTKTATSWKEIARMQDALLKDFTKTSCSTWYECVGVGECICFRAHGSVEVVAYNVRKCTWAWLPKCDGGHRHMFMRSLAYQPWSN